MARRADIQQALGIKACFCGPWSPCRSATNEQANGILRRWLPKGTDLNMGAARLSVVEDRINNMPGKLHYWNTAQTA